RGSCQDEFICIYPSYVNRKKTLAEGRLIPAEKAVENPTCAEIRDVLTVGGANVLMENEMYSRELNRDVMFRGRVRVQLKQEDGTLCSDKFASLECKDVMMYCAEMISKLKTQTQKGAVADSGSQQGEGSRKIKKRGSSYTKSPMLLLSHVIVKIHILGIRCIRKEFRPLDFTALF
uniref:Signal recognition particle 19 kDa protein n=1 Tax=Hucho hucho TaxID=62062 RepID=A0A4W5M105_9TELE